MKTVTSLPNEVVVGGLQFVDSFKVHMLSCTVPAFSYFLIPDIVNFVSVIVVGLFYLSILFISKYSRILWQFGRATWFKLYGSLLFGLSAVVFFRFFDINTWLIHEVGYIPEGEVKHYFAAVFFVPLVAAYFDSFKEVELSFYRSKGYDYRGWITNSFNGL